MATLSSSPAWKSPWTEEPGGLQSMGSLRVSRDWAASLSLFTFMHWRRKWQPTPVYLPGESQGQGCLVGCRLWSQGDGHDWSDLAAATALSFDAPFVLIKKYDQSWGFPGDSVVKNPSVSAGDARSLGQKISWRRKEQPLQYSRLGNSMDRGTRQATVHKSRKESDLTEHAHVTYLKFIKTSPTVSNNFYFKILGVSL